MAVLSSSCTILDPNFCCFHEERHGTRRFCVAPSNSLEIFGETIITKEWKMGQCSTKKPGRRLGFKEITHGRCGDSSFYFD